LKTKNQTDEGDEWEGLDILGNRHRMGSGLAEKEECMSERSRLVTLIFCIWFGIFGAHRFYIGKTGIGFVWLFTFGVFGVGWLVDVIMVLAGRFFDKEGRAVLTWFRVSDSQGNVVQYFT
jgi:TM2 domain-containing membrane protein YozV